VAAIAQANGENKNQVFQWSRAYERGEVVANASRFSVASVIRHLGAEYSEHSGTKQQRDS